MLEYDVVYEDYERNDQNTNSKARLKKDNIALVTPATVQIRLKQIVIPMENLYFPGVSTMLDDVQIRVKQKIIVQANYTDVFFTVNAIKRLKKFMGSKL